MGRSQPKGEGVPRDATGAVVDEAGGSVRIEELQIDPPGRDEVLVRMVASGVCHSDLWAIEHGNWGAPFPMLLGHEGAGIVEEAGDGARTAAVGDPVVLAWAVPCGSCGPCRRGVPRRCSHAWVQPPRVRRARDAAPLAGTLSLGTLATHTVVHAAQAIPMPAELPLRSGCLLGCGVSTGVGAATQTARVWPGARVAVIGLGGIGLAALQGARIAGAERLIAVDVAEPKLEWAKRFGATDTVDASEMDAVAAVRELTGGDGVDFAFEATGVPAVVSQAVAMLDYAGVAVAIGVPPIPAEVTLAWNGTEHAAYPRKTSLLITDGGDPIPSEDFPKMARWALEGRLDLDGMVSRELSLHELDEAFRAMLAGEVIRSVVVFDA
jgi:S-(hydroxymethyl)mycothiol dehydrogenase